ncbi:Pentatricopeptide repeat-containing protein [Melia azedarach]|uniref:Pentatricopeptide repeat-containing protein n=1 Tax=Melia azedarach TaxID=155640 RepID=A0ACC1XKN1_MELAZ|nr:Pentatricopeptide repeat-containing protein [Melia azedarach]
MIPCIQRCLKSTRFSLNLSISGALIHSSSNNCSHGLSYSPIESSSSVRSTLDHPQALCVDSMQQSEIDVIIANVRVGSSEDEVFQSLKQDHVCNAIQPSRNLVNKLLCRFKDDWKCAWGIFRWAGSCPGYKLSSEMYEMMVDILGKMKQMDRMIALLEEMSKDHVVTLNTVAKVMRRFSGAGQWENALRTFDELGTFGLEKNTETMNLLLDTLCKEHKVEQARKVFLELKSHISPNAYTFNIFIHGWCKVNRVDEAHWTIQEMKGHGYQPSVISYSTIIQFYCRQHSFCKVFELLDEMQAQGCPPNVVTYTTVMCYLAKVQEAVYVYQVEMPENGVPPSTSTYNTLITMFCHHAQPEKAFYVLEEMEKSDCKPDVQTFYPLLKSCFKTGKTDSCLDQLLDDVVNKHHLSLDLSTYSLLIHGLCRANEYEWAYLLFEEMIGQDITPKYQTCCMILDEVRQKNMYDAAEKIEDIMKKL